MTRELRTLDVWDTLLRRRTHPDCSKLASARALALRLAPDLKKNYLDYHAIFRERCMIEGEYAKRGPDGEYTLAEVMAELITRIVDNKRAIAIETERDYILQYEFEFEIQNTYPDPHIRQFIESYPAKKTLYLSDFYMPAADIQRLLDWHGVQAIAASGISSCDVGLNKRSGRLFRHVHEVYDVEPKDHVHIGDNAHADVKIPKTIGIDSVLFQPDDEHGKREEREKLYQSRDYLFRHITEQACATFPPDVEKLTAYQQAAWKLGLNAGPLVIGFVLYIAEQSLKDKVEKLYFFTREGEFYLQVWKALFPDNKLAGQALPAADTLEVSRLATFCASLRDVSTDELMRVWNLYSTQSLHTLFITLAIDPEICRPLCEEHGINMDEDIVHPWKDAGVQALFKDVRFRDILQNVITQKKNILEAYLHQHGCTVTQKRIGIVDIGWRGTIQDNLSYLLPDTQIFGYYMGLQAFLNVQPDNCIKSAFGPDANRSHRDVDLLDAVSLLEMLCNAPSGSVLGYQKDENGKVRAVRIKDDEENKAFYDFVLFFQQALLQTAGLWREYIDRYVVSSEDLRDHACVIWRNFLSGKNGNLMAVYESLNHNETFGVGKFIKQSNLPEVRDVVRAVFHKKDRQKFIQFLRHNQLVTAISGRSDIGHFQKIVLVCSIRSALQFKRARNFMRILVARYGR